MLKIVDTLSPALQIILATPALNSVGGRAARFGTSAGAPRLLIRAPLVAELGEAAPFAGVDPVRGIVCWAIRSVGNVIRILTRVGRQTNFRFFL